MTQRKSSNKRRHGRPPKGRHGRPRPARADQRAEASPWLYGLHAVQAALANPDRRFTRLLVTVNVAEKIENAPIAAEIVEREIIDAVLPDGAVHQGIALLAAPLPEADITALAQEAETLPRSLVVALDQVTDPQNVGAVMRSAAAFGAIALVVPERGSPEATGALAKAASGALESVPLIRPANLVRALEGLKESGFWVVGLDMDAPLSVAEAELPARCALVLGAEGRGLRRLTAETCDMMVRIPIAAAVESLNVSASAAVALYEWRRQGSRS